MPHKPSYREAVDTFDWNGVRAALGWPDAGDVSLATTIVDRHVAREAPALIWIGKDGSEARISYRELSEASSRFANALRRQGVKPGDRIAGLMPRRVEALIAVIGTLKAGAVYVPMFTAFQHSGIRSLEFT